MFIENRSGSRSSKVYNCVLFTKALARAVFNIFIVKFSIYVYVSELCNQKFSFDINNFACGIKWQLTTIYFDVVLFFFLFDIPHTCNNIACTFWTEWSGCWFWFHIFLWSTARYSKMILEKVSVDSV